MELRKTGTEEQLEQRNIRNRGSVGTVGTEEQRNSGHRGAKEQRNSMNRGTVGTVGSVAIEEQQEL